MRSTPRRRATAARLFPLSGRSIAYSTRLGFSFGFGPNGIPLASHLLDPGQRKDLVSVILKLETELWHRRRRHMSGFKRNVKAVRKDLTKVVRRRIEKRTHAAGARISEVAKLLRSSVRDVQSRDSPFACLLYTSPSPRDG